MVTDTQSHVPDRKDKAIPKRDRKDKAISKIETRDFDLQTLVEDKFTLSSSLNKPRFEQLERILKSNGLYSLAINARARPVATVSNKAGYSEESYALEGHSYVIIPADNIRNYAHDLDRLSSIILIAFDKTLYS